MNSLHALNRKAKKFEQDRLAALHDVEALQDKKHKAKTQGRVYYPLGCTLHFSPGWEVDVSGGTADWTSKCSAAANDWRQVDVIYP
jgi:hypothetical protein